MNIRRELKRAEFKKNLEAKFKRAIQIIRNYVCQHKNCASEIVSVSLGNTSDSVIAELLGEEQAKHIHTMRFRRVYCLNCGREIYRTVISYDESLEQSC